MIIYKGQMILILGGARSGKSRLAVEMAGQSCGKVAYIATGPACDEEMKARIRLHKKVRPKNWFTIESQKDLPAALGKIPKQCNGVIIECIGTYCSNLMLSGLSDQRIVKDIKTALQKLVKIDKKVIVVSNEVGSGLVPENALGRRFRDITGSVNQVIAGYADEVYFVTAGLPMRLK